MPSLYYAGSLETGETFAEEDWALVRRIWDEAWAVAERSEAPGRDGRPPREPAV